MNRLLAIAYGAIVYCVFLLTFLYAIAFVGNLFVPKSIDIGATSTLAEALLVNVGLLGLFAAQHSIMARPVFKRWWTKLVPQSVERTTYVLFASALLALLLWQWRPITATVWSVESPLAVTALHVTFWLGWGIVLFSTFLINHFELFGLAQVVNFFRGRKPAHPVFRTPSLYRVMRHPLYFGFLLAFWSAPVMSAGHLLFAIATTGYILLGIFLEERDLIAEFGDQYRRYRATVRMLLPLPRRRTSAVPASATPGVMRDRVA
jgi:protein-S-isoprenylcysteine O-methyltransferase Ste14